MALPLLELPYLTADIAPVPCAMKDRCEDFVVEELALYEPCGEGTHVYIDVEKTSLTTFSVARQLETAFGRPPRSAGFAGLKDARAVARQRFSLEHVDEKSAAALQIRGVRVLAVARHTNKIQLGHLRGNRFRVKLRGVAPERRADLDAVLATLERRGVPNFFGEQRFGARGDGWAVGRALVERRWQDAAALIAGRPNIHDRGHVARARSYFDSGDYQRAAREFPVSLPEAKKLAGAMHRKRGEAGRALAAVDSRVKKFWVSAWQSYLFNAVLSRRLGELDRVCVGDLAWKHDNGTVFLVEDETAEAPRAARGEISPSGPLYGRRMSRPGGLPDAIEREVLARQAAKEQDLAEAGRLAPHGGRRPLRFRMSVLAVRDGRDQHGEFVELAFDLPPGCYATAVTREIGKSELSLGTGTASGLDGLDGAGGPSGAGDAGGTADPDGGSGGSSRD